MPWSQPFWTLPVGLWDEDAYTSQLEPLEPVIDLFKSLVLTFVHLFVPVDVPRPDPKAEFGVLFGLWLVASVSQNLRLAEFACGFHFPCFIRFVLWNCSSSCPKRNCTATWCEKSSPFGLLGQFISPRTIPMSTYVLIWVESLGGDESSRHHIAMDPEACLGILSRAHAAHAKRSLAAISTKQSGKLAWNFTEFSLGP